MRWSADDDEVRRGAEHRRERPQHAAQGQVGARQQIQDEHEPDRGDARAGERQRAGTLVRGAATATTHDGRGRGVLDQQRRADVHRRDGREERELRAGHGDRAVQEDGPRVAAQQPPACRAVLAPRTAATTSAPMAIRASTTAPGLQPASSSPRASEPDSPNDDGRDEREEQPGSHARRRAPLSSAIGAMSHDIRSR